MYDYYVYLYYRLDTNEPFYVGKGHDDRCYHMHNRNEHFTNIVNSIPTAVVIIKDNLTEVEAFYWEEELIRTLVFDYGYSIDIKGNTSNEKGYHLVNRTWGGEGCSGVASSMAEAVVVWNAYTGEFIGRFDNAHKACIDLGIDYKKAQACICRCCNGEQLFTNGYIFKYESRIGDVHCNIKPVINKKEEKEEKKEKYVVYDKNGNFVGEYFTIRQICDDIDELDYSKHRTLISRCISQNNKIKSVKGYIIKYPEDESTVKESVHYVIHEEQVYIICSKCHIEKPATTEYFYKNKNSKYGVGGYCKECVKKEYHSTKKSSN